MSDTATDAPPEPDQTGWLPVGDGHELYWESVGEPSGIPVVLLHGGPGIPIGPACRRWFDPARHRAILFDQRGCGRSRPLADSPTVDLRTNTTDHLIADIEELRRHLDVGRWSVVGLSWGVTLGLAYAQHHPERVERMVLGAVTAGRRFETEWITSGMRRVFPREWEQLASLVPDAARDDLASAYSRLLADPDPAIVDRAALEWCRWEDTHVSLAADVEPDLQLMPAPEQRVFARLVTHYWSHGSFLDERPILDRMEAIAHIPAVLIHGRRDVSSPLDTAWDLHRRWPASELRVLDDAGHGGSLIDEVVNAINEG